MKNLRHAVGLLVPALIGLVAAAGAAVVFLTARKVITPGLRATDTKILAVDTAAQTIELARTPDTELPGRYGLFTTGTYGYVKLGAVLTASSERVRRKLLTQIEVGAQIDQDAAFSGFYYTAPSELHLPWETVQVGSAAGPCPAWLFPADGDTWVVQIHGRGATRAEGLRAVPVFHAAGMPVLIASYRNDGEGPRTRAGSYALGATEWQDVDAAIGYALRHGATRVVLMGWSMGGAIALQTALNATHRAAIAGLVLDSPVVDWRSVLRFQARMAGLVEPLPALAMEALGQSWSAKLSGADAAIDLDALDLVARADELTVPTLILHSEDDGFVPSDASHALAQARPDVVTMPRVTGARHTKLWNYDQTSWSAHISGWLAAHGFSEADTEPQTAE